jgi:hypothetical protein
MYPQKALRRTQIYKIIRKVKAVKEEKPAADQMGFNMKR